MTVDELRALYASAGADQIEWTLAGHGGDEHDDDSPCVWERENVFGAHVGEDYTEGVPCRITTGSMGFDDSEALHLAVAAVNALPALLSIVETAALVARETEYGAGAYVPEEMIALRAALEYLRQQ